MRIASVLAVVALFAAPLSAQQVDTLRLSGFVQYDTIITLPRGTGSLVLEVEGVDLDSLTALGQRPPMVVTQTQPCCQRSGPPGWFYGGVLVLGAIGLWVWADKEETQINIHNEQSQEQSQTTTVRGPRIYWPPGHRKKRKHGG